MQTGKPGKLELADEPVLILFACEGVILVEHPFRRDGWERLQELRLGVGLLSCSAEPDVAAGEEQPRVPRRALRGTGLTIAMVSS